MSWHNFDFNKNQDDTLCVELSLEADLVNSFHTGWNQLSWPKQTVLYGTFCFFLGCLFSCVLCKWLDDVHSMFYVCYTYMGLCT